MLFEIDIDRLHFTALNMIFRKIEVYFISIIQDIYHLIRTKMCIFKYRMHIWKYICQPDKYTDDPALLSIRSFFFNYVASVKLCPKTFASKKADI